MLFVKWSHCFGFRFALAFVLGCSDDKLPDAEFSENIGNGNEVTSLQGAVQKGPFVIGSSITVSILSERLVPTGEVFNTQTVNDSGEFAVEFSSSSPVSLQGEGFYYNEVTGQLSNAPITLRAFYIPGDNDSRRVYVNMITHLTMARTKALVENGTAFSAAAAQAQNELVRGLALTAPSYLPTTSATAMNVAGDPTADNAYLLGLSATLIQYAVEQASGSVDAALQEVLNSLTLDLADGSIEGDTRANIRVALSHVEITRIAEDFSRRLTSLGLEASVPDMAQVLDQDGDGTANRDDLCPHVSALEHADTDADGIGDLCDPCPATVCEFSCLPASSGGSGPASDLCYQPGTVDAACTVLAEDAVLVTTAATFGAFLGTCEPGLSCIEPSSGEALTAEAQSLCGPFETCCRPAGKLNQPCLPDASCEGTLGCSSSSECGQVGLGNCCLPTGGAGQACRKDLGCQEGLRCRSSEACISGSLDQCCMPEGGEGQLCGGDNSDTCNSGLTCLDHHTCYENDSLSSCCVAAGGLTEFCLPERICNDNLLCVGTEDDQAKCLENGGLDGPCLQGETGFTCNGELSCVQGSACGHTGQQTCCQLAGAEGQPCFNLTTPTCNGDLYCLDSICIDNTVSGAPCQPGVPTGCGDGLSCQENAEECGNQGTYNSCCLTAP